MGGALVLPLRGQLPRPGGDLTERGAPVDHSTIYRWVQRYGPELDKQTRWYRRVSEWRARSWRVDETYLRVDGKWCYLYRAVTSHGDTLDFSLSTRRNTQAAKRFLAKTLRSSSAPNVPPRVINTDKNFAPAAAIIELRADGRCAASVQHRRVKYLNNLIEGDHGRLKRILGPKCGFKTPTTAYRTLKGDGSNARAAQRPGSPLGLRTTERGRGDRGQSIRLRA